jgi:hypothetical protein
MREALEVARDGARTPHEAEEKNGRLTVLRIGSDHNSSIWE